MNVMQAFSAWWVMPFDWFAWDWAKYIPNESTISIDRKVVLPVCGLSIIWKMNDLISTLSLTK